MNFKVGDRVYFYFNYYQDNRTHGACGLGEIKKVTTYSDGLINYDVLKDGEDYEVDGCYYVEPEHGEIIISEELYNSPLYKALR